MASDHYSVANALRSYVGPDTPDDLAGFLFREADKARELADALAAQAAEIDFLWMEIRARAKRQAEIVKDAFVQAEVITKLTERCDAYKGQVEAGAAEIERLTKDVSDLEEEIGEHEAEGCRRDDDCAKAEARADALAARVAELEAALTEAEETLQLCEHPATQDSAHRSAVAALGDRMGYGALMSTASGLWREYLIARGLKGGGEFVSGPCHSTVISTLKVIRAALQPKAPAP